MQKNNTPNTIPFIKKKNDPVSLATALYSALENNQKAQSQVTHLAMSVFPPPGGPNNKIPLGGYLMIVIV